MSKRILSILLTLIFVCSCIPTAVCAQEQTIHPVLKIDTSAGAPGAQVDVRINIENNPGIQGMEFQLYWDEGLEMIAPPTPAEAQQENGEAWRNTMVYTPPAAGKRKSGCSFVWAIAAGQDIKPKDQDTNGTILKLKFRIPENAEKSEYKIWIEYVPEYNMDIQNNPIVYDLVPGTIVTYMPGDVAKPKGVITAGDAIAILRYISDGRRTDPAGYNVTLNEAAANVNDDFVLTSGDATTILRYISDGKKTDPLGYNVKLTPSKSSCLHIHHKVRVSSKKPTCTEDGNIEHWKCTKCGKLFADSRCTAELSPQAIVHKATGHTEVIDPYVAPQPGVEGWTEGSHCSVCGQVIRPQEQIPALEEQEYLINYHVTDNDGYLKSIDADAKNPNPKSYTSREGLQLRNMNIPGYIFLGWYDGAGGNAQQIKTIAAGSSGDYELYAHWERVKYTVEFDSPDVPVDNTTYTVDKGINLPKPTHFGYTFVGWSMDGNIITEIKPGYLPQNSNKVIVHANWTSNRNQTRPVSQLADPSIIEDVENGRYLFLYKIGTIENVPLNSDPKQNFGYLENLSLHKGTEINTSVQASLAETAARTVSNATTCSSSWTLSDEWTSGTTASNEHAAEVGKSDAHTRSDGSVENGKWYVGNNHSGTTSVSNSSGGSSSVSAKVTNQKSTGLNSSYANQWGNQSVQDRKHSVDLGAHAKAKKFGVNFDAGVDYSYTNDKHNESYDDKSLNVSMDRNTYKEFVGASTNHSNWNTNQSTSSSWNTSDGYEAGHQTSHDEMVSKAISEKIYNKDQISSMHSRKEGNSNTSSTSDQSKLEKEYTSAIEHSTEKGEKISLSQDITSPYSGYYRLVTAGTIHVYAVVGYDIATNAYFTYTYNILDANERHPYLDYSLSNSNFNDCENGVLPFEVPYEVQEFVGDKLAKSAGLDIDVNTGKVSKYTGSDEYVVLPEYMSVNNQNGTHSAVKVTGIAPNVFRGNQHIRGVYFPKYVSTIPNYAFEGCTAMDTLVGNGLVSIGEGAFKNCTSMSGFVVDNLIFNLGNNAFSGVENVRVVASDAKVADAALKSGAKSLTLDLQKMPDSFNNRKIVISDQMETIKFWDSGVAHENLEIESHANTTILNNLHLTKNSSIPLKIYSPNLTLNRTKVESAPGLAMVLFADQTNIKLFGDNNLSSAGESTMLAKKLTLSREDPSVVGKLNVSGTTLLCDSNITNPDLFNGTIKKIDISEFDNYLNAHKISFDAAGGSVSPEYKTVTYGSPYGDLPIPTKEGYNFLGWYTEAESGEQVTEHTVCNSFADFTVYAHWSCKEFSVRWNDGAGYRIDVRRRSSPHAGAATGRVRNGDTVYYGDTLEIAYIPNAGYTIRDHGLTSVTVTGELTSSDIYAVTGNRGYRVSWNDGAGYRIDVRRTSSPQAGAATGRIHNGDTIYYGDTLEITYIPNAGYTIRDHGLTSVTVTGDLSSSDIYAVTGNQSYHVNWNGGTGYTISVERTQSPRGASTGRLQSGAEIFYGDVLRVRYQANTGYTLTGYGAENITVNGNVDGSRIYASARVNQYTYRIVYRSVNGTDLGSDTITRDYGVTEQINAPGKSGYHTPGSQQVKWDVAGNKDIVFQYQPQDVSTSPVGGRFSDYISSGKQDATIDYGASFEYRNRTADSVEIRLNMSLTLKASFYNYNAMRCRASVSNVSMGDFQIVAHREWGNTSRQDRTAYGSSTWVRVPIGTTNATTVTLNAYVYQANANGTDVSNVHPGYENLSASWQINVPAF